MNAQARETTGPRTALVGMLALGAALVMGRAGPVVAGTVPIVSCPALITAPGTYVLAADLSCPPFPFFAISVRADNVHLVLGTHVIRGSSYGVGASGITGLSVTGGTFTGFIIGMEILDTSGTSLTGVTVTGNRFGFELSNCTNCAIVSSTVTGNVYGMSLIRITGSRLASNTVTGNSYFGIGMNTIAESSLTGNIVTDNTMFGLFVQQGSTGNRLTGNSATGNTQADLDDENPGPPCANTWRGNRFGTVGGAGAPCIQ